MTKIRQMFNIDVLGEPELSGKILAIAHEVIVGDYHLSQKKAAMRKLDEAMGFDTVEAELVEGIENYMKEHADAQR